MVPVHVDAFTADLVLNFALFDKCDGDLCHAFIAQRVFPVNFNQREAIFFFLFDKSRREKRFILIAISKMFASISVGQRKRVRTRFVTLKISDTENENEFIIEKWHILQQVASQAL